VKHFRTDRALELAEAMVQSGLWDRTGDTFTIHDYQDFNYSAKDVKARRARDRQRKRNGQSD
jgi:hypothetical protein